MVRGWWPRRMAPSIYTCSYSAAESRLSRVDAATSSTSLIVTPRELGLDAVGGVDGKIYFAQGYGQNRVSVFDPATGAFDVDVTWLRAPPGSYIVGFVAR